MGWVIFALSFISSLILVPVVRWIGVKLGKIDQPRKDRWHERPIPTLGGTGIFLAFISGLVASLIWNSADGNREWGLLIGSGIVFCLGLIDDFKPLSPPTKLIGQILAAAVVIFLGYTTNFFTPRIPNTILAQVPNIILTFVWLVGITNAVNLLDNMDGLAGGIATITAAILALLFWRSGNISSMVLAMALCGSTLGFLVFNFPPAKIFMGDSGSQFLGFSLAVLAIARQPQASNVFAVLGVPTLLFLLPILDTTFVTITRLLQGRSPAQGGRDHTSHRLVAFGLSERQALVILYGVALIAGILGILIETLDYWLSLLLVPLLVIFLALFAAYLARVKVLSRAMPARVGTINRWLVDLTYRRRLFEVILDFFVIGLAYYLAFWLNHGSANPDAILAKYLSSLPLSLASAYSTFFVFGVYRGMWRYVGVDDLLRYAKAAIAAVTILLLAQMLFIENPGIERGVYILYLLFLFFGLAATRSSFKIFDRISGQQSSLVGERILVLGGGDAGEMALRWILMNPGFGYKPVGILDSDALNVGRQIHGITILGGFEKLEAILKNNKINGIVVTSELRRSEGQYDKILSVCNQFGCWVRVLRLEFELIEG